MFGRCLVHCNILTYFLSKTFMLLWIIELSSTNNWLVIVTNSLVLKLQTREESPLKIFFFKNICIITMVTHVVSRGVSHIGGVREAADWQRRLWVLDNVRSLQRLWRVYASNARRQRLRNNHNNRVGTRYFKEPLNNL